VLSEVGFPHATIREIAQRASVNPALLHYYFGTKSQLHEAVMTQIADEFITHARAIRAEHAKAAKEGRAPDIVKLLKGWGGSTIAYRRFMAESPSYTLNHEEVEKALEEGISFAEGLSPVDVELDSFGHARALSLAVMGQDDGGRLVDTGEVVSLPARTVLIAAGTQPNTVLARETDRLAGMIVEPLVQCAGGFRFHSPDVLKRIVETARAHDLIVIFDEIATGFGRTGRLFAADEAGVAPDIMTLSKAMTGGTMPLAVTVASTEIFEAFLSEDPETFRPTSSVS